MTKLQVALDFLNESDALDVASKVYKYVDFIEAGTPLIKSCGISIVKKLKEKFPDKVIVADLKTMDVGSLEAEMAIKNGADIVSILAVADDETMKGAVEVAKKYNAKVMADLINHPNKRKRAGELESIGVDYILFHTGIDQQNAGLSPLNELKKLSKKIKTKIAVAGGLNEKTIPEAVRAGSSVIIIGGAITKAEDCEKAAENLRVVIDEASEGRS